MARKWRIFVTLAVLQLCLSLSQFFFLSAFPDALDKDEELEYAHQPSLFWLPPDPSIEVKERLLQSIGKATDNPLTTCSPTSQVAITTGEHNWTLQSHDEHGTPKTMGGDEYYIRYLDDPSNTKATAVAHVIDQGNGMYMLDFVRTPMTAASRIKMSGEGVLTVDLQYTCGMGRLPPPTKDTWFDGGSAKIHWSTSVLNAPPMRQFETPTSPDLSQFDTVYAFGDSLIRTLVERSPGRLFQPNLRYTTTLHSEFNSTQFDFVKEALNRSYDKDLKHIGTRKVALLMGSAVWDILQSTNHQGTTFNDHLDTVQRLVEWIRQNYPEVTILWKSPSALHIHRVSNIVRIKKIRNRVRYLSSSRAQDLYHLQKKLMQQLKVTFLDVYEAYYLSADYCAKGDGRHYEGELNKRILSWFYGNLPVLGER